MATNTLKNPRPYRVVVVEDSKSDAQLIMEGLRKDGRDLKILLLPDGERASSHFGDLEEPSFNPFGRPDLILLDLNLPKKSGADLIGEIKAIPRLRDVPLVIFSGADQSEEVWHCYELGANLVVLKPLEVGPFLSLVQAIEHYCLDVVGPRSVL